MKKLTQAKYIALPASLPSRLNKATENKLTLPPVLNPRWARAGNYCWAKYVWNWCSKSQNNFVSLPGKNNIEIYHLKIYIMSWKLFLDVPLLLHCSNMHKKFCYCRGTALVSTNPATTKHPILKWLQSTNDLEVSMPKVIVIAAFTQAVFTSC